MDPIDNGSGNGDVLSQSDVEKLLAQVASQEANTEVLKGGGERLKCSHDAIQPYDFRQPIFLSAGELRKLRLRQEDFTRSLAARLSIYLRLEFGLQMSRLTTITYQKFIENLQNPTHLTLFKAEPLRGICILEIPPQLGMTIVDRLLGGPAKATNLERDISDIEAALLDQAVQIILNEWCNQWSGLRELRPVVIGHESSGRFLQVASHDTVMLNLAMEARVGDCQDTIQLGFPCYTLEPLMRQLSAVVEANSKEAADNVAPPMQWNKELAEIHVPVSASWTGVRSTMGDVGRLKVGDVLNLGPNCVHQVQVRLGTIPKFTGRLGTLDNRWAVELNQVLKS